MTTYAPPPHPGWHVPHIEPVHVRGEAAIFGATLTRIRTLRPSTNRHHAAVPWLSQPDLARLVGVTPSAVYRLEAGERTPKAKTVCALCDALDATPEERAALFYAAGYVDRRPA